ncbi:hypothetical protein CR513_26088, partial [Mucuna pruriens]
MEHFLVVVIKIKDLNLEVALHSMIMVSQQMALKPKLFSNSLCKRPPTSMDKLRARASSYIQMEEMVEREGGVSIQPIRRKNKGGKMSEDPNTRKFVKRVTEREHLRRKPETSHRRETTPKRDKP